MMAARRGFQANGDNTSVVRPAERVPLRNLQNELLGQQLALSATKVFSKSPFKKKGETVQGEGLPHCSPLCRASNGIAPLIETALTKENTAANTAKRDESVAQKGCPDSLLADLIDKGVEPQTRTSFSSVLIQSDMTGTALTGNAEDVSGMGLTGRAEEWANSVSAPDQQASVGCLSDSLTSCQTQTATGDSAVEPCTDGRAGEVTFRSLHCSGVELEIADTSSLPEESVVLLPERSADLSSCCSFQKNCSGHLDFSQHVGLNPSNKCEDHAYCLQKRGGSCFRDALLPEECSEKSVTADQSQDSAEKGVTVDQSQDKTENNVIADQSQDSVTADQMQNKVEQSLSADQSQDKTENCVPAQAQDTTEKSLVADQSQGIAEKGLAVDQSQSTAVQGLVAECREHDAVLQTGGSDVTPGHTQERYSETPSCVETGSPALAKTSRLWQEAPGCPWNTVDSPVGPRGSRLWMGILESPMPLPQLNSTLIQPIPIPTTATSQTREPDSGVLPTPAKGGTGPELAPLQTKTSFSSVLIQSDITGTALTGNAEDVSGMGLTGRAEEWANSVSAPDQQASVGCLSDSLTSCQTQTATGDSAVEPCTDGRAGEVTFRSLHCSGVELEIADTSSLPEESVVLLPERSADLSSCCSFQKNCSGHLDFSQHVGLNPSNKSEDHAYCLQKRGGSCFRDALLPEECSEKSVTADQSQDKTENIVTADQSRATVTADQMQNKVEQSLSADQSQDKTENCVPAQAQDTTEKSLVADQSQGIAEKGLAVDLSQSTAVQGLVAECREHDAVLQTGGSDVTPGHGQERYSETPSCVETGSPALAKTSRLRQGGPRCPWDTVDSPVGPRGSRLCMGILESPMPQPQLNSTLIQPIPTPTTATSQTREPDSGVLPTPAQGDIGPELAPLQTPGDLTDTETGPPQENLAPQTPGRLTETQTGPLGPQAPGHQACTKSEPLQMLGALWTPGDLAGPQSGPLQERLLQMGALLLRASQNMAPAVEQHSASTWTSPVALVERSVNTSGLFERRREVSVAEASTSTDSLHWIVAPEAVAGWSRRDLEQRFFSSITMVEALSQQLASAQTHTHHTPPISELRDRVVQTDLTELSQGVMYRELCVRALERLRTLELQQEQQERLLQELRSSSTAMAAMAAETERALSSVNEMGQMASEDQDSISQQMCRMRALYGRFRQAHRRMEERVERCEQEKLLTEQQREEALRTKEASLLVLEQLQCRHAAQVAELERSVGSHLELIPALSTACQEQVSLNEEYVESLQAADELLKGTISDQSRLSEELSKARFLLRRTGPVLLKLHQEAAAALQAQNQQQRDTEEIQDELELTASRLYDAQQQIGDLNLQVTILTSEMAVLRQRMGEVEEERAQVEMKSTELSATLSSTQASCSFLQQALNAQTKRMEEVQEESSQRVEELERALAGGDVQLAQAQAGLLELQTQLASTCEINEFLQMESEVSLEQVAQSEALVKSHLQGLRERNLECEDLKQELCALRLQRDAVQEEVLSTREKTRNLLLDMGNQLALASTDITLLHHKVYMLTCALKTTLNTTLSTQKPDRSCKEREPPSLSAPPRRSTRSFVDSVMVATTEEADETDECPSAALGSGNSAFTRVTTAIPRYVSR
ncbi:sperm-associated antigen 5 [Conger conger]|uniref:sperm-associated antigen 5 n=1 Tax=Conger conger TaxID=82655 RepID=UPI002A5A2271|nr:sperm-associated antigen 5 [Conger conger]